MKFVPHGYQAYSINYLTTHPVAALLLDMGLGKTVITLMALWELVLDRFEISKVLVIAPKRVAADTWPREIAKWDNLKGLTYSLVLGSAKERQEALDKKAFLYIINRENVTWLAGNHIWDFDCIVIDELSSFKSNRAMRFKSLRKVRPLVKRVIGLTGTPAPNSLMDLWAEMYLLDMGKRLGRFISGYRDRYFSPDKRNGSIVYSYKPYDTSEQAIYAKISDICISMKAAEYLEMPALVSNRIEVGMAGKEKKLYESFRKHMCLEVPDGQLDAVNAAGLANKLLQMANGAVYDHDKKIHPIHNRKLDALEDLIEAANGKPVLVAYWFKHDLARIKQRFSDIRTIDTESDIADWNDGNIPVALIHPASAGHGLNLQEGGSCIIWFGLTWSLELYQQTNARLWRQGQKQTVVIQHIVTKGTIDEDVLKAIERKDTCQKRLIDAVKARLGGGSYV